MTRHRLSHTERLLDDLLGPTFSFRMARAMWSSHLAPEPEAEPMHRSAWTRRQRALWQIERLLATWAATRIGHGYDGRREVHPGYPGDPRTCLYGNLGWVWINDGQNLVCPVCGLDGT